MKGQFEKILGEPVGILCARSVVRGIVSEVKEDGVVLGDAVFVVETGAMNSPKAKVEEQCAADLFIAYGAIELFGQFPWAFNGIKKGGE
jgi:hypothetical protein